VRDDLDRILRQQGYDALVVVGPASHNPDMTYFTGSIHLSDGILVKPVGRPPVLYCASMEREEAASSGLRTEVLDVLRFFREAGGEALEAEARMLAHALSGNGVRGRVAYAGRKDVGQALEAARLCEARVPGLQLVGRERWSSPLLRTRATKDPSEIERIRQTGRTTVEVVGRVAELLTSCAAPRGFLVGRDGQPLTVGAVKRRIRLWLAELGAEDPEGTIFAVGRDAGIPHSAGRDDQPIPVGRSIVFDIFPRGAGGGYFYDFTRTWCLGHAPVEVEAAYAQVMEVYRDCSRRYVAGAVGRDIQQFACERFEAMGHPTQLSQPSGTDGYVHGIGHGLGLDVHEPPAFSLARPPETLAAGHVVTLEPGLYYPERGFGVRLEDTFLVLRDGPPEVLAEYPMDLVLPLRRSPRGQATRRPTQRRSTARPPVGARRRKDRPGARRRA